MTINVGGAGRSMRSAGLSLVEVLTAMSLLVIMVGALLILTTGVGKSLISITSQATYNQNAGNGIEFIVDRIQLANFASNSAGGETLTISVDDDPDTDSNGDGITWNDQDRFEQFIYQSSGTNWGSASDNFIGYKTNRNVAWTNILVPSTVRQLSSQKIFFVSNNTVWINFGLLTTNQTPFSQAVEIRTKAAFRNKLNFN
jgi:hypothetical protein